MINNSHNKYIIFILLQSFLYGLGNPLTKIAFASITPLWCLAFRFGLAFSLFRNFLCNTLKETAAGTFCKPISASRIMYGFSLYFM